MAHDNKLVMIVDRTGEVIPRIADVRGMTWFDRILHWINVRKYAKIERELDLSKLLPSEARDLVLEVRPALCVQDRLFRNHRHSILTPSKEVKAALLNRSAGNDAVV